MRSLVLEKREANESAAGEWNGNERRKQQCARCCFCGSLPDRNRRIAPSRPVENQIENTAHTIPGSLPFRRALGCSLFHGGGTRKDRAESAEGSARRRGTNIKISSSLQFALRISKVGKLASTYTRVYSESTHRENEQRTKPPRFVGSTDQLLPNNSELGYSTLLYCR